MACSIAAVVVGVGLCASTVGYSISFRRDIDRVATTGVPTTGTVTYTDGGGAQGDSEVCAVVQIEGSRSPECITIADPSHLDAGRAIAVRYDRRNPDHEILVGDLPEPRTAETWMRSSPWDSWPWPCWRWPTTWTVASRRVAAPAVARGGSP